MSLFETPSRIKLENWCQNAVHSYLGLLFGVEVLITSLIDKPINDALRLVIECMHPTLTDYLFVPLRITPTELRRKRTTLSLACCAQEPGHLLHDRLTSHPNGGHRQLSQDTPWCLLLWNCSEVHANCMDTSAARWADHRWSIGWREGTSRPHSFLVMWTLFHLEWGFPDSPGSG